VAGRLRQLEIRAGRVDQLRGAVQAAPEEAEPRYRLGLFLLQNGREEEGRNLLNDVLRLNPRHGPARAALAADAQRTGRRPGEGGGE
jgi:Flp pilus assembly protein TadD